MQQSNNEMQQSSYQGAHPCLKKSWFWVCFTLYFLQLSFTCEGRACKLTSSSHACHWHDLVWWLANLNGDNDWSWWHEWWFGNLILSIFISWSEISYSTFSINIFNCSFNDKVFRNTLHSNKGRDKNPSTERTQQQWITSCLLNTCPECQCAQCLSWRPHPQTHSLLKKKIFGVFHMVFTLVLNLNVSSGSQASISYLSFYYSKNCHHDSVM